MKTPIIVLVVALACYTIANLITNSALNISIVPLSAAIFAAIGAFVALSISHGISGK